MSARSQITGQLLSFKSKAYAFLDFIPSAIAVWSRDGLFCALNERTMRLTGYSTNEFQNTPSLWISRIHPLDTGAFLTARKRLEGGEDPVSCEYRFLPKGLHQERWLNETSRAIQTGDRENMGIISVYSDVSEFVALRQSKEDENRIGQVRQVIDGLTHEVTNNLQVIRGAFDSLSHGGVNSTARRVIEDHVEQTNKLMKELSEYFYRPSCEAIDSDPAVMLEELARRTKNDLLKDGIRLQVVHRGPLLPTRIDPAEFRKAFDKVLEFSRAFIPDGGELKIDAGLRKIEGERYLELTVSSTGKPCIPMQADDVFRPFLRVGEQSVGLSMILAQEILRRNDGKIVFEKSREKLATFRILLRTRKDQEMA
jgi:PAS domain S-box-containing protein